MAHARRSSPPILLLALLTALFLFSGCALLSPGNYTKPGSTPMDNPAPVVSPPPVPIPAPAPAPAANASVNTSPKDQGGVTSDDAKADLLTLLARANSTDMKIKYQASFQTNGSTPPAMWSLYRKSNLSRIDTTFLGLNIRTYQLGSDPIVCTEDQSVWACLRSNATSPNLSSNTSGLIEQLVSGNGSFSIRPQQTYAGTKSSCYRIQGGSDISFANGMSLSPNFTDLCLSPQGVVMYLRLQAISDGRPLEYTLNAIEYSTTPADSDFQLPAALVSPVQPHLEMDFYDVGFGDATLVQSENLTLLIDTGPMNQSETLATSLLQKEVSKIDVLLISSWDVNKLGGLDSIFKRFTVSEIWIPGAPPSSRAFDYPWLAMQQAAVSIRNVSAGDAYRFGAVSLEVFNPPKKPYSRSAEANSVVLRLRYHGFCAFMPGDIADEQQASLVGQLGSTPCDVYKWPYHGRGRPETPLFFDRLKPVDVVISSGPNELGLPSPTTLERLRISSTNTWRTDTQGDILVNVNTNGAYTITNGSNKN